MFVGHYAIGFALKRAEPRLTLGLLVLAVSWLDLVLPTLVLLGVEHLRIRPAVNGFASLDLYDMPFSHSVTAAVGWSSLAFVLYRFLAGTNGAGRLRPALILSLAAASHFVLDLVVHDRDLPLVTNGSMKLGLGLWRSVPVSMGLELGILAAGALLYVRAVPLRRPSLRLVLAGLVLFQAAYLVGCFYGLMPKTPNELAVRLLVEQSAFIGVVEWFDRRASRRAREGGGGDRDR